MVNKHYKPLLIDSIKATADIEQHRFIGFDGKHCMAGAKAFSITVVTRNLRTNDGAYTYLDKVKSVLTGFEPEGCSKLMPSKDFFISENNGIWQYGINFTLTTPNIQEY